MNIWTILFAACHLGRFAPDQTGSGLVEVPDGIFDLRRAARRRDRLQDIFLIPIGAGSTSVGAVGALVPAGT